MAALVLGAFLLLSQRPCAAQNDWQYPDPYFGILEIEKSHDSQALRRYRAEVSAAPRRASATPSASGSPRLDPAMPGRQPRVRWRQRAWR